MDADVKHEGVGSSGSNALVAVAPTMAGSLIAAMYQGGGSALEVPKPFSQPICLIPDTRVAGTSHVPGIGGLVASLGEGDRLRLERDPQNRYDPWAIRVLDARGRRLGFVPTDSNEILARLMDGGRRLFAEVTEVELRGSWHRIGVGVWLDD